MTDDNLPPPPVEPLPDLAWARVERAVLAELDVPVTRPAVIRRARWVIPAIAGTALAAAAAIAVVGLRGTDPELPARETAALPSRVVTGTVASDVSFGDARIAVAPGSTVVLDGTAARGVLAVIERGGAAFAVASRRGRPPFTVQAGAVAVRVIGTEFTVTRIGDDDAVVEVRDGVVEVVSGGRRVDVGPGERWSSVPPATADAGDHPVVTADLPPDLAADPDPIGAEVTARRPRDSALPARPTPVAPDRARPQPTEQDRYEAASGLEARDPIAAIAGYRELARGRSVWAANALYALGRLYFDRGDHDAARPTLTDYLRRFPRGANAAGARALLSTIDSQE